MRSSSGKSIYDDKFSNIHKLFYSRADKASGGRYTVDAVPDNFQPLYLFEIDDHSELFDSSDYDESSSSCENQDGSGDED